MTTPLYIKTDEGIELPVIDLTNPDFAFDPTEAQYARMLEAYVAENAQRGEMPPHVQAAIARSIVGQGLMAAKGTFLTSLNTYILKLGGPNLREPFAEIDRRIVDSFPCLSARLRMQDMARLVAERLTPQLDRDREQPLLLVNIAGGPAADSWNTLIFLNKSRPELLALRKITIAVLDEQPAGPQFGMRAVDALRGLGGPLEGLDITMRHIPYNWSTPTALVDILHDLGVANAIAGVSSEGGLFEYGSDQDIIDNLHVLAETLPVGAPVVGSVTRKDQPERRRSSIGVAVNPRSLEEFTALATSGGWTVDAVRARAFSFNVRLISPIL